MFDQSKTKTKISTFQIHIVKNYFQNEWKAQIEILQSILSLVM